MPQTLVGRDAKYPAKCLSSGLTGDPATAPPFRSSGLTGGPAVARSSAWLAACQPGFVAGTSDEPSSAIISPAFGQAGRGGCRRLGIASLFSVSEIRTPIWRNAVITRFEGR